MCKVSVERACRLGNFSRGGWYRKSTARDQSGLRMRIRDIAMSRPRFGYARIHVLLRREGWHVNLKRVHRLYCLEGLQVRKRVHRKKRMSLHRGPASTPTAPGQRWNMDFVHDQLVNGQPFRVLTVVDNWSRESPVLEVGFRLTGSSVAEALSRIGKTVRCQHASRWTMALNLLPGHWTSGLGRTRCSLTSRALESLRTTGFASHSMAGYATNV